MRKTYQLLPFILFLLVLSFPTLCRAAPACPTDDPCKDLGSVFEKVNCYAGVVNTCSTQRESMATQVIYLSTKVQLTSAKIESTKEKISKLENEIEEISGKIVNLEDSLTKITGMFIKRIAASYKYGAKSYLDLILGSRGFSDFINRYKYIQTAQTHDRSLLFQLQNSKENFKDQKVLREEKKKELDSAKKQLEKEQATLAVQKKEKELFLETTKNSEERYRTELNAAKAEAEGIQKAASILSSAGVARRVSKGDTIGLMGNTGFSTGAHLHFAVYNLRESDLNKFEFNSGYENPVNVLSARTLPFDPTSCDDVSPSQKQTKSIGSGSWDWPMSSPDISQCFGHTPWSWRYQTGIHNGLDMWDDANPIIKAVDSGNAYTYRGGQSAGNGVFIFHDNGKMTLYWHLQ